jgi:hypothetical protein
MYSTSLLRQYTTYGHDLVNNPLCLIANERVYMSLLRPFQP